MKTKRNLTLLTDLYQLTMMQGYYNNDTNNHEVVFDLFDGEEINDFQRDCYTFVETNLKKLYKMAIKAIKKHIKTKGFHEQYISDYDINKKEIFDSIVLNAIYFARTETRGFGFLGGWEADIEHGLGVKFVREGNGANIVEIGVQDILL